MPNELIIGIFAGVIVSILGNLLVTSLYEGFITSKSTTAKIIFWFSAILLILFIAFFWIKYLKNN